MMKILAIGFEERLLGWVGAELKLKAAAKENIGLSI